MINSWENYIERAKKLFLSKPENEVISHGLIEMCIGISKENSAYLYVIKKAKDMLLDMGVVIKSVPGTGYIKLSANEIPQYVYDKYIVSNIQRYSKANKILSYVATDDKKVNSQIKSLKGLATELRENAIETMRTSQFTLEMMKAKELNA